MAKYDIVEEKEKLHAINEELIDVMKECGKSKVTEVGLGNSINDGYSMSQPGAPLLDRNPDLKECGKNKGVEVETYQLCRSENNNAFSVYDWVLRNYSEKDAHDWNRADYRRYIENGSPLLTEEQINEYFSGGSEKGIQEVLFNPDKDNANIVIINLGTGSFLDVVTRHGSLKPSNIFGSVTRDAMGISSILELIENNNRINNSNTQVCLCGAPRIANTAVTDIFMNPKIKKVAKMFANTIYIPSFPRQAFYKTPTGAIIPDPHYNEVEYIHLLSEIENGINENYFIRSLLIALDRELYQMSNDNDVNGENYTIEDVKDLIDKYAKMYKNYNEFLDYIKPYINYIYPFLYFRASTRKNISKELPKMKKYEKRV